MSEREIFVSAPARNPLSSTVANLPLEDVRAENSLLYATVMLFESYG